MLTIDVRTEFSAFARTLNDFQRNQLPYAAALALAAVAREVEKDVRDSLPSVFDKPTPFTQRGPGSRGATKRSLTAEVFVRDRQAQYLALQEMGGTRKPEGGKALTLPVGVRVNQYGNIPHKALARLKASSKEVFVGQVRGIGGFWQRRGRGRVKLLAAFRAEAKYQPRFGYWERVTAEVKAGLPRHLGAAMARAMATARPR